MKPHLDRAHLHALYRQMLRIRRFEGKCVELYECEQQNRWTNDHARRWTTGHHAT
jgi:TPP-dependent pyruvate/acetoin dehydrogenase alpha subunit